MKMLGLVLGICLLLQTQIGFAGSYQAGLLQSSTSHIQHTSIVLTDFHWNNGIP